MVQVHELIVVDLTRRGSGKDEFSPVRTVLEVYTKEGVLLAFHDSQGNYSLEEVIEFGKLCQANTELSIEDALKKWKP